MQEWLNWIAWKAVIPQKGIGSSNLPLSANPTKSLILNNLFYSV